MSYVKSKYKNLAYDKAKLNPDFFVYLKSFREKKT